MIDNKMAEPTAHSLYKPQLTTPSRVVLPPRFGFAGLLLLALIATALNFVYSQLQPDPPKLQSVAVSPISRAEAAPVLKPEPTADRCIDEAAALLPEAATRELPTRELPTRDVASAKIHTINMTVEASKPAVLSTDNRMEQLTAQGIAAGRAGDYTAAETSLRAALALDRGNPVILYNLGLLAERRGDSDSARTLYEATLQRAAERPDTPLQPEQVTDRLDALDAAELMP